ncbi:hypothetical protein FJQ54_14025 [Sandaracinobacter neustonicus]|uniref:Uncharacterized protein n=1 Tax=Sandaracinobacter neustonicus TaxID=1715348 RepID=A0A501XF76_9SPHN|nr:hypothetical protein [Sandaracinobacter neustonicus]TPE59180.1 hypothetical protein FJQ54_14025 [Sandaracinobacter neustonicus]
MLRTLLILLSALALAAAGPAPLAGDYVLTGVREAAGGLELRPDGRFSYALTYGALDETAEGVWRQEGDRVLLTTEPKPRPAKWEIVNAEPGEPKVFALILENPRGQPIPNFTVYVKMNDGSEERGQTLNEWLEADLDSRIPVSVRFEVPVFDIASPSFPVDIATARRYRFRFDPADTGVRDFQDWPLLIRGSLLAPVDAPDGQGFRKVDPR